MGGQAGNRSCKSQQDVRDYLGQVGLVYNMTLVCTLAYSEQEEARRQNQSTVPSEPVCCKGKLGRDRM